MPTAQFVWTDDHGAGRNVFAIFRRRLELKSVPEQAVLHLFADTRYRLRVNGTVANYGPARFSPTAPEYDDVDVAPFLSAGWNVITVEVQSRGANAFDAMPSRGGFISWGRIPGEKKSTDLSTPGQWTAQRGVAWDVGTPIFCFAQGPLEIIDHTAMPSGWCDPLHVGADWPKPVAIAQQSAWGTPTPRSIPLLGIREQLPERTLLLARIANDGQRIGFRDDGEGSGDGGKRRTPYATHLHSLIDQDVTLSLFWGPHFLNGIELKPSNHAFLGNCQEATVHLRAGWNFLYGEPEMMTSGWQVMIGIPPGKDVLACAQPQSDCADAIMRCDSVSESVLLAARTVIPTSIAQLPQLPTPWRAVSRQETPRVPAREMGWDTIGERLPHDGSVISQILLPCTADQAATVVFDLGGEMLGHVMIDLDAPAGAVVDIAVGERLRCDGLLDVFTTNWMISEADRFIAAGGDGGSGGGERYEGFHPRGGRYVQITVRRASRPVTLRRIAIRNTGYPVQIEGSFACSDPFFDWLWRTGAATQVACMEDTYLDCPWRERGLYTADAMVQYCVTRAITADARLARRCLWLWSVNQRADGQLLAVVPTWWSDYVLHDFSLFWLLLLHDYWSCSGDRDFIVEMWPTVARLLASPCWTLASSGLIDADSLRANYDGLMSDGKPGESGPLNAHWCRALHCAGELATAIGRDDDASALSARATTAGTEFVRALFMPSECRFAGAARGSDRLAGPAPMTNALALGYGLVPKGHEASVIAHLEATLDAHPAPGPGHQQSYFYHHLLVGLAAHGRSAAIERLLRRDYGVMQAGGAWTLWEYFTPTASLCHAWSAAPVHYLSTRVLGVRPDKAGNPDSLRIAPNASSITWARGTVPHRRGPITIAWHRHGQRLEIDITAPKGLTLTVQPEGSLADLPCQINLVRTAPLK